MISKMAQWVKARATKPDDLCSSPGFTWWKERTPSSCLRLPLPHLCVYRHACKQANIHI